MKTVFKTIIRFRRIILGSTKSPLNFIFAGERDRSLHSTILPLFYVMVEGYDDGLGMRLTVLLLMKAELWVEEESEYSHRLCKNNN